MVRAVTWEGWGALGWAAGAGVEQVAAGQEAQGKAAGAALGTVAREVEEEAGWEAGEGEGKVVAGWEDLGAALEVGAMAGSCNSARSSGAAFRPNLGSKGGCSSAAVPPL
jgi:hypothetical protein